MASFMAWFFLTALFSAPEQVTTMRNATGITQKLASTILQSKNINMLTPTRLTEAIAPISSGIQWLDAVSIIAQSPMILVVRSAIFFFPKYESGSFLSFSAMVVLLTPLSL